MNRTSSASTFANPELFGAASYQANNVQKRPQNLQSDPEFRRPDIQIYISNLPQRAGVPIERIRKLVLKELVDNALDEMDRVGRPGQVTITQDAEHTYTVTDQGRGFADTPQELAKRFSLDKPMTSSKQWRRPTRGCVGNGLRVIVGSVVSGGGRIIVKTRNQRVTLCPRLDGTTAVEDVRAIDWPIGAAVTIEIDPKYAADRYTLNWAEVAIELARNSAEPFARKPSPWWYDRDHLALNMLSAIGHEYTLARFVQQLDRCSSREIGQLVTERFGKGRLCRDVNQREAADLLEILRKNVPAVIKAKQLGPMGPDAQKNSHGYAIEEGTFKSGNYPFAEIPFLVEAWAATRETPTDDDGDTDVYPVDLAYFTINRSPAICGYYSHRKGRSREVWLSLGETTCHLSIPVGAFNFAVNITSPYVVILSDNKSPSLDCFKEAIIKAVEKALQRSARKCPPTLIVVRKDEPDDDDEEEEEEEKPERIVLRKVIWEILPEAIKHCCFNEDGVAFYEFNQRDLFYAVRRLALERGAAEPKFSYFTTILTDYENEVGEIELITRDARGVFSAPGGPLIAMGTKSVAAYERPAWEYSNFLFVEKEKLVTLLKQVQFDIRWDCFITTSKGFCTRAGKDLLDKIAEKEEPTKFFSVHDADASGSLINQSLINATKTRGARNVEVIDLGFFPWTAIAEGLLKEPVETKYRKNGRRYRRPVSDCVKERDLDNQVSGNPNNEPNWESWLQDWRVELNAITPSEFVRWINAQFEKHGAFKLVPSEGMVLGQVTEIIKGHLLSATANDVRAKRLLELTELNKEIEKVKEPFLKEMEKATKPLQRQVSKIQEEIDSEIEKRTAEVLEKTAFPTGSDVVGKINDWLKEHNHSHWRNSIDDVALNLIPEEQRPSDTETKTSEEGESI